MRLPVRTALADIEAICAYFAAKPAGATLAEIINERALDRRKLSALKFWGLIEAADTKLRLTERGLLVVRNNGALRAQALRDVIAATTPYAAIVARAVHRGEKILLSVDVAAHWHRHFRAYIDLRVLNHQTVCFLRVAEGANLGRLVVGRKGQQTRFELSEDEARAFTSDASIPMPQFDPDQDGMRGEEAQGKDAGRDFSGYRPAIRRDRRVFITRRENQKITAQVKELVEFERFEPIIAQHRETAAMLAPHHLMNEMRGCDTAVIHVCSDAVWLDADRQPRVGGDALIEIGAAMALFGRNFVLLVEEGVALPSTLQGLCECRYSGDELSMPVAMKLLRAFEDFMRSPPSRPLGLGIGAEQVVPNVFAQESPGRSV
jgi:hypothetical protein